MGVHPKRLRQSPMLTPHTDSLSCGLLASGNSTAHHFEVKPDIKGSARDREGGRRRGSLFGYDWYAACE